MQNSRFKSRAMACGAALITSLLGACASQQLPPITPVAEVDIARFMGPWYVIAVIPTAIETEAYNAVESYQLNTDGTIATTFTFNKGAVDGPLKTYHPRGFVREGSNNAVWGMQFIWPIKAEYLIAYLDSDYQHTIIARNARDYVWIMARQAQISEDTYQKLVAEVIAMGYDSRALRKVPQKGPQLPTATGDQH